MRTLTYLEAWKLWLAGQTVQDSLLWGAKILWWGRLGKVVEFLAATTIIADIIGPERLRKFGNSLHLAFTLTKAKYFLIDALKWIRTMFIYNYSWFGSRREEQALDQVVRFRADTFNYYVCLALTAVGLYFAWPYLSWWNVPFVAIAVLGALWMTLSPITTALLIVILSSFGVLIDLAILEPMAWLLERKMVDRWVKIISVVLLILGFHFDLLAS